MSRLLATKDTRSTLAKERGEPTIALCMTVRETRRLIACLENKPDPTGKLRRFAANEAQSLRDILKDMKS